MQCEWQYGFLEKSVMLVSWQGMAVPLTVFMGVLGHSASCFWH